MRINGLKMGRYVEWLRAVWAAGERNVPRGTMDGKGHVSVWRLRHVSAMVVGLVRAARKMVHGIRSGYVDRGTWRARMRVCSRCPVWRKEGRVCLVEDGGMVYGCGCYTVFKGMVKRPYPGGCWGKEYAKESGIGWE